MRWCGPGLAAFFISVPCLLRAADTTVLGATGGHVESIVFDANNPNIVYAGGQGGGISKSLNAGDTWTSLFYAPIGQHSTQAIVVSTKTANLILVGEQGGTGTVIARSANGGTNFTVPLTMTDIGSTEGGDCFALAEGVNANTFYAGVLKEGSNDDPVSKIYKSVDNGVTWTALTVSTAGAIITDLIQLPNGNLVVGTRLTDPESQTETQNIGGIFTSTNDGDTWTSVGSTQGVLGFAYNGNGVLMAATADGSRNSSDGNIFISSSTDGVTWSTNYKSFPVQAGAADISSFFAIRYVADNFYLLSRSSLYKSGSAPGYSWAGPNANLITKIFSPVPLTGSTIEAVAVKPDDPNTILIGSQGGDGLYKTTDANLGAGAHWIISNTGLYGADVRFAEKEFPSAIVYAADQDGMIYVSNNTGSSFTRIFHSSSSDTIITLAIDSQNPARVLASLGNYNNHLGLNISATSTLDDGYPFNHADWDFSLPYPNGNPDGGFNFIVKAALMDGDTIYAGISKNNDGTPGNYLYKSVNGGLSWSPLALLTTAGGIRALAFDPSDHNIIYAGSGDNYSNPSDPARHANGLFKSTDAGQHWTPLDSNTTLSVQGPDTIVVDSTTAGRLWVLAHDVTTSLPDVWESVDSGAHWTKITPPLASDTEIRGLTYATAEKRLLIAEDNDIYGQIPGSGSTTWTKLFSVYGNVEVLFNGSAGAGTGTGLYETTGFATTAPTTGSVNSDGQTLTFDPPTGLITLTIPGGTFGQTVTVTMETPTSILADPVGALTGQLLGSGVAVDISNNLSLEPVKNVDLTISYRTSDITGLDENKLVIARYDTTRGIWVPYASTVDTVNHTITAHINHFSTYQVMQMVPSDTVNTIRVFPNPFRPALGHTQVTFANLPADSRIRIYTLRGEEVAVRTATPAGIASWDGTNKSGRNAASGIYLAFIEGNGQHKTVKVAVER